MAPGSPISSTPDTPAHACPALARPRAPLITGGSIPSYLYKPELRAPSHPRVRSVSVLDAWIAPTSQSGGREAAVSGGRPLSRASKLLPGSRPAPRQALARPPRASLVALSLVHGHLSPAWSPPSPVASPTVRLPLASAPRPLASRPLLFLPPLPSGPSSAPRPFAGCRLPPPRSTVQPQAGSPHPGSAEPPLPAPRLAAVRGAHRQRWRPLQLVENRGSGGGGWRAGSLSSVASCEAGCPDQGSPGDLGLLAGLGGI